MRIAGLVVLAGLIAALGWWRNPPPQAQGAGYELRPPRLGAEPVVAQTRQMGQYPAGSRIEDRSAPGGFGRWDNFPKRLDGRDWGVAGAVSVVAFPDEPVAYFKNAGLALRVVNRTGEAVPCAAIDSFLRLACEARPPAGEWRAIEEEQMVICGNSFHRVFLGPGEYWEFPARRYDGPVAVKLRYRLDTGGGLPPIYSNEFDGRVTLAQLVN